MLKKHKDKFRESEIRDLARIVGIPLRDLMKGSDKNQVLEFLGTLNIEVEPLEKSKSLTLQPIDSQK